MECFKDSHYTPKESAEKGLKHDDGKLRLDLIPPEVIEMLGEIYTYGSHKYGANNWEKGFEEGRLLAAARRHDLALAKGEMLDPESGLPHTAHAAWNYLTLETLRKRNKGD